MSGTLIETGQHLEFSTVVPGDILRVTTGTNGEYWQYCLDVTRNSYWPEGTLTVINPRGETVGPVAETQLQGCGIWTTPQQNPVQKQQGLALTPYFEGLSTQRLLVGKLPGHGRVLFGRKGDEIIHIARVPYRENTILGIIGAHDQALSAGELTEAIPDNTPVVLAEKEVRQTLKHLVESGHLRMLKKQQQLYESADRTA